MNAALERVLNRLDKVRADGDGYTACCPAHNDRNPSLSISGTGDRVLLHCHAGCTFDQISSALNVTARDLTTVCDSPPQRRIVDAYNYTDATGRVRYQVVRYDPKDFRQRQPDGHGGWIHNTHGVERVLYRLPEVHAAIANRQPIWIVEGEKDVHALEDAGQVATCSPGGAGKWAKVPNAATILADAAELIVVADKDDAGRKHADDIAQSLNGHPHLRVVQAAIGKDAADHLAAGRTIDQFEPVTDDEPRLADTAEDIFASPPDVLNLTPPTWLAQGLLLDGTHGEIGGEQKSLKSYIAATIGVGIALGAPVLDRFTVPEPRNVLFIAGEGGEQMLLRRIQRIGEAYGATWPETVERIRYTTAVAPITSLTFQDQLAREIELHDPAYVNIDPWYTYAGADLNAGQLAEVGERLELFRKTISGNGERTLVINHHLNQTGTGTGLVRLSGAGHAEWCDSWLLLSHRKPPDVDNGAFQLKMDVGSRQWGGAAFDVTYNVGRFDIDTGQHDGPIHWEVFTHDVETADDTRRIRDDIKRGDAAKSLVEAWRRSRNSNKQRAGWTKTEWIERATGTAQTKRQVFAELCDDGRIQPVGDTGRWSLNESEFEQ